MAAPRLITTGYNLHGFVSGRLTTAPVLWKQQPKAILLLPNEWPDRVCGQLLYKWRNETREAHYNSFLHLTMIVADLQVAWKYGQVFIRMTANDEFLKADLCLEKP